MEAILKHLTGYINSWSIDFIQLSRWLIKFSGDFCQVDFYRETSFYHGSGKQFNGTENDEGKLKRPLWTKVTAVFYIYCMIKFTIMCFLEYSYDYHMKNRDLLQKQVNFWLLLIPGLEQNFNHSFRSHKLDAQYYEKALDSFGAPLRDFHYMNECFYIDVMLISFICYIQMQYQLRYLAPYNSSLFRMMLNQKLEQENYENLIVNEVKRFIDSSSSYVKSKMLYSMVGNRECYDNRPSRRLILDHLNIVRLLKSMALMGKFQPINRQNEWIRYMSKWFSITYSIFSVYCSFVVVCMVLLPVVLLDEFPYKTGPMDLLHLAELALFLIMLIIWTGFHLGSMTISAFDQIHAFQHLNSKILLCIAQNRKRFHLMQEQNSFSGGQPAHYKYKYDYTEMNRLKSATLNKMNADLIYVVLHYKLLVHQYRPLRRVHAYGALFIVEVIMMTCIIARYNARYLNHSQLFVAAIYCSISVICGDCCLMPLVYISNCTHRLYRNLFSLACHMVELKASVDSAQPLINQQIYDPHLFQIIQKELADPEQLTRQFATTCFGIDLNYPTLLRYHFWSGILIITTLYVHELVDEHGRSINLSMF